MSVIIDMLYYYRYAVEQTLCQALLRASCEFVMLFRSFCGTFCDHLPISLWPSLEILATVCRPPHERSQNVASLSVARQSGLTATTGALGELFRFLTLLKGILTAFFSNLWRFFVFFRFLFELRFGFEKTLKKALKMIDFGFQNRTKIVTKSNQK